MSTLARVSAYTLSLIGLFTGFSYFGIPQVVPEPPPKATYIGASMTIDEFTALGASIYERTCVLCHSGLGDRAPKLDRIGSLWRERVNDPRYRGKAMTLEAYLRESMVDPSIYVVQGFGRPGTADTESPMPDVSKGAIRLSAAEIDAVIAYLQSMAGEKVSVSPSAPQPAASSEQPPKTAEAANASDAVSALTKYQCNLCHQLPGIAGAEETPAIGPDLRALAETAATRAPGQDASSFIRQSILAPDAVVAQGFAAGVMPADFGQRMRAAELEMIVDYLAKEH
jgi:cytochrome c5